MISNAAAQFIDWAAYFYSNLQYFTLYKWLKCNYILGAKAALKKYIFCFFDFYIEIENHICK